MVFENFEELETSASPWEGRMPGDPTPHQDAAREAGFVPMPCSAGDLVLIHGQVDHMSFANTSPESRHTYQLHLIEGPTQGVEWSPSNWLQYKDGKPFPDL